MIYRDPILVKLRDVLNAAGPRELKDRYYFGDPIVVDPKKLPACFISIDRQTVGTADNTHLESRVNVVFNVVWDHKRDMMQALDNIEGHMNTVNMIAGRDPETYALRKDSMISALRAKQELGNNLWIDVDTLTEANYGLGIGKRGPGIYTAEATLRTQVIHHQIKPELL